MEHRAGLRGSIHVCRSRPRGDGRDESSRNYSSDTPSIRESPERPDRGDRAPGVRGTRISVGRECVYADHGRGTLTSRGLSPPVFSQISSRAAWTPVRAQFNALRGMSGADHRAQSQDRRDGHRPSVQQPQVQLGRVPRAPRTSRLRFRLSRSEVERETARFVTRTIPPGRTNPWMPVFSWAGRESLHPEQELALFRPRHDRVRQHQTCIAPARCRDAPGQVYQKHPDSTRALERPKSRPGACSMP